MSPACCVVGGPRKAAALGALEVPRFPPLHSRDLEQVGHLGTLEELVLTLYDLEVPEDNRFCFCFDGSREDSASLP